MNDEIARLHGRIDGLREIVLMLADTLAGLVGEDAYALAVMLEALETDMTADDPTAREAAAAEIRLISGEIVALIASRDARKT